MKDLSSEYSNKFRIYFDEQSKFLYGEFYKLPENISNIKTKKINTSTIDIYFNASQKEQLIMQLSIFISNGLMLTKMMAFLNRLFVPQAIGDVIITKIMSQEKKTLYVFQTLTKINLENYFKNNSNINIDNYWKFNMAEMQKDIISLLRQPNIKTIVRSSLFENHTENNISLLDIGNQMHEKIKKEEGYTRSQEWDIYSNEDGRLIIVDGLTGQTILNAGETENKADINAELLDIEYVAVLMIAYRPEVAVFFNEVPIEDKDYIEDYFTKYETETSDIDILFADSNYIV